MPLSTTPTPIYMYYIEDLISSIMNQEKKRLETLTTQLVVENHSLGGHRYGFYYLGKRYSNFEARHVASQRLQTVHESLTPQVHALHTQSVQQRSDEQKLRQSLGVVLSRCKSRQDVRDTLPEVLVMGVLDFRGLSRLKPEGFILENHPVLKEQYMKAIEIAKYYTFNKMVY